MDKKQIPVVTEKYDVIVAGGGIAGISAALAAGRCISVTTGMWDITRVIPTCAVTGEAAGTAAALTDDFSELDIAVLQERLL